MDLGITDRVAIVMASTGGLGAATAQALAAEGARVVVTGRDTDRTHDVAASLPTAIGVAVDLTAAGAVETVLSATKDAFGTPDIVVLNGPGPTPGSAADLDGADVDTIGSLLLKTQISLVHRTLGAMREQKWGRILAVGSSGVEAPLPMLTASNIGRAGLAAYLKTLATEVAFDGVTVNMLLPGRIATDRVAALDAAVAQRQQVPVEQITAASQARIPTGRYGRPGEFGATAAFICSDPASYLTGSLIRCDGGLLSHL